MWNKFEEGRSRHSRVIDRKPFLAHFTLTFDPVTPISIEFICYPGWMCGPSLRKVDQDVLQLLIVNGFGRFDAVTLTFDPVTPKSIGFIWIHPGWMCGPSLKKVGQGVLELLIGNEKVTDGQTDRPTCEKQYTLSSSKVGIITSIYITLFYYMCIM